MNTAQKVYNMLCGSALGSVAIKGNTVTITVFKSFPGETGEYAVKKLTRIICVITNEQFSIVTRVTRNSIVIIVSF